MSLLQNAIDSIALGVEDYQRRDDPRRMAASVRNSYAGMMLLFKHKLAEMSKAEDEALIKQMVLPVVQDGKIIWKGRGKKTADLHQIRERCRSLGIEVNWKAVEDIQRYRNDVEHYFSSTQHATVRQYLVQCFIVVRDFIMQYLEDDPRVVLGEETWRVLVAEEEFQNAEGKACRALMDALEWSNDAAYAWISEARCNACGSNLLRPRPGQTTVAEEAEFQCAVCGQQWSYETLLEVAGSPHDTHASWKDGGDQVVGTCPECGAEGYDAVEGQCVYCGAEGPFECLRCGQFIPTEELGSDHPSLCGWCLHMSTKQD